MGLAALKVHCRTPLMRAVSDGTAGISASTPACPFGVAVAVGTAVGQSGHGEGSAPTANTPTLTGGADTPPELTPAQAHPGESAL